ncbi:MAG TPA: cbb3-type cytochrome c oxidase subunit II [Mycobacteriales bacterium]|nr:cbb3-type cytochrome c oxidase subunit II [Mycobacteriales bacterium]
MRRLTLLPALLGSAVMLGAGFAVTVALPAADAVTRSSTDTTRAYTNGEVDGREVYVNQGCVYCHTQQVRDTYTDAGLAERPTRPGDTLTDRPGSLGEARFGPDLRCVGDRAPGTADESSSKQALLAAMVDYLRDPGAVRRDSGMPSYGHLSDTELERLAMYLVGLSCGDPAAEVAE